MLLLAAVLPGAGNTLRAQGSYYTHGEPTADEQYVLELINRARANPAAEGERLAAATTADPEAARLFRFYPGDLTRMQAEFRSYPARPPLGFHAALMKSAHAHNQDMEATDNYSFTGTDGSTQPGRVAAAGYPSTLTGGNIGADLLSAYGMHYALLADFSRPDLGHRHNLMNDNAWYVFREAGIAIGDYRHRYGTNLGAYVTEDLGTSGTPLAVGVAYRDNNSDGFYSIGEGLPGMVVTSPASHYYTVTGASGGYSLPLDLLPDYTAGTRSVDLIFTDLNGTVISRQTVVLSGSTQGGGLGRAFDNVKADLLYAADGRLLSPGAPALAQVSVAGDAARGGFVITRRGDPSTALTVTYHVGGGALAGTDYEPLPGSVSLPAGQGEAVITLHAHTVHSKVKVFLDAGCYTVGKAQSKLVLADLRQP